MSRDIGLRLARASERPNLPWHFTVVDSPAINAFALPGGYIYVTRGILPFLDNEAELAGVLGHEIGHVTARHSAQQYSQADRRRRRRSRCSASSFPAARPLSGVAETAARRAVPEVRPRRRAAGRSAGRAVRRERRMGSGRRAGHADDPGAARRSRAAAAGRAELAVDASAPADRVEQVQAASSARSARGRHAGARSTRDGSCAASTASCSATARARASSAATVPAPGPALRVAFPAGLGDPEQRRRRSWPRRRSANDYMLLELVPNAAADRSSRSR